MKIKYCICTTGYDGQRKVLKSFRNRPEAIAFANDEKNVRQFGDMIVVEKMNHPEQAAASLGAGEEMKSTWVLQEFTK